MCTLCMVNGTSDYCFWREQDDGVHAYGACFAEGNQAFCTRSKEFTVMPHNYEVIAQAIQSVGIVHLFAHSPGSHSEG